MAENFDIIDYISGMTPFVFDKSVIKRIAYDRGVIGVEVYDMLDIQTKELLKADLLYEAYLSPDVWASSTNSHGSYTKTIGSQSIYATTKEKIYDVALGIYKKYEDPKLEEIKSANGSLEFIDTKFGL